MRRVARGTAIAVRLSPPTEIARTSSEYAGIAWSPAGIDAPGTMRIDELGQQFDLELEHEDVDSVSGLILMLLGRPPQVGDAVRFERLHFEVTAIKGHGVEECAVTLSA